MRLSGSESKKRLWSYPVTAWVGLLARQILGWVLFIAGLIKITNIYGTGVNIRAYRLPLLTYEFTEFLAWAMPLFEIVVGLMLICGAFTRIAAALGTVTMLVFVAAIASVWARGISIDCGCFGVGGDIETFNPWTYFWDIVRDIALAACGVWLLFFRRTPWSVDNWIDSALDVPVSDDENCDIEKELENESA